MNWAQIIRPLWHSGAKHIYFFLSRSEYRTYYLLELKYGKRRRSQRCVMRAGPWLLSAHDARSFINAYKLIFVDKLYKCDLDGPGLRVLDLGANLGVGVMYFKQVWPQCHVTAYEADPDIYAHLVRNVHDNGFEGVELVHAAIWNEDGQVSFRGNGKDGGQVTEGGGGEQGRSVPSVDIRRVLAAAKYDFIKMDVEGAEAILVPACRDLLAHTRYMFIEYHSEEGKPQELAAILAELTLAGFRYHIHDESLNPMPLFLRKVVNGFDMQLNIFAWQDRCSKDSSAACG
jgi:FkbM family methyltransferase